MEPDREGKKRSGGVTVPVRRAFDGGFNQRGRRMGRATWTVGSDHRQGIQKRINDEEGGGIEEVLMGREVKRRWEQIPKTHAGT